MKKTSKALNLIVLTVFVGSNLLTPISYAVDDLPTIPQSGDNLEIQLVPSVSEGGGDSLNDLEQITPDSSLSKGEDDASLRKDAGPAQLGEDHEAIEDLLAGQQPDAQEGNTKDSETPMNSQQSGVNFLDAQNDEGSGENQQAKTDTNNTVLESFSSFLDEGDILTPSLFLSGENNLEQNLSGLDEELTGNDLELLKARETLNSEPITDTETYNKVTVSVEADTGTFPESTELRITPITIKKEINEIKEQIIDSQENIVEDSELVAFDISFIYILSDGTEIELQPKDGEGVKVSFNYEDNKNLSKADKDDDQEIKVFHIDDKDENGEKVAEGEEVVKEVKIDTEASSDGEVVVNAESFSIYAVIRSTQDPTTITVTYNANQGAFSDSSTSKVVTYTKDANGLYVASENTQAPNRDGYMFDGWYDGDTEWLGVENDTTTTSKTVSAHWLEFDDLDLNFDGVSYTIMDRNLGAEAPAQGIYNNGTPESLDKIGKYYQWGNNHGFRNGTNGDSLTNTDGNMVVNTSGTPWGPGNYYSSATFIKRDSNTTTSPDWDTYPYYRWDVADNANLWGGTSSNLADKQGPCPEGYHVPSNTEWQGIYDSFTAWKNNTTEGTNFCNTYGGVDSQCFAAKLQLPFAGYRYRGNSNVYNQGSNGYYWSSTRNNENNAYSLYFNSSNIYPQNYNRRSNAFSVRCFKDSPNKTLTFHPNGGAFAGKSTDATIKVKYTKNSDGVYVPDINVQNPNLAGYMFDGWYTTATNQTTERRLVMEESTTITDVYAKWLGFEPYDVKDDNGNTLFTIMDRNLGATTTGTTCSSSNLPACGKLFQWGNNYGFDNSTSPWPYRTGSASVPYTDLVDASAYGPGNYYSSSTFILRPDGSDYYRWDKTDNANLWGGAGDTATSRGPGTDADRQGPCPANYHVPSTLEWKSAYNLLGLTSSAEGVTKLQTKLWLPFAGSRYRWNSNVNGQGANGYYWSSTRYNEDTAYYLYFYSSSIYPQDYNRRSPAFSVRCFKDSPTQTLTFVREDAGTVDSKQVYWYEPIQSSYKPSAPSGTTETWYTDAELTSPFTFGSTTYVTQAKTLYSDVTCSDASSIWDGTECIQQFTVTLDATTNAINGGTPSQASVIVNDGSAFSISSYGATPGDNTYTFRGWAENPNSDVILESDPTITSDTTFYAVYSKTLAGTFNYNATVSSISTDSATCTLRNKNSNCTLSAPSVTCAAGYNNGRWTPQSMTISENETFTASCSDAQKPVCNIFVQPTNTLISTQAGFDQGTVTFTCTDNVGVITDNISASDITYDSDVVTLSNFTAGGNSTAKTFTFTYTAQSAGSTTFSLNAGAVSDAEGNSNDATVSSNSVTVDTTAPSVSADKSSNDWYAGNVNITLSVSDTNGLNYAKYSWVSAADCLSNGTDFTDGTEITQTLEGENTLYLCVQDNAGNTNTWNGTYKLDKTAPTCTITGNPTSPTNQNVNLNVAYLVEAHQIADGYSWNGENYSTTQGFTVTENGTYTAYVKDAAGNVGSCSEEVTMIDKVLPEITINNPDTTPAKSKTITASTNKGTLYMSVGDDDTCDDSLNFVAYDSITFNLESDNGKYVCYKAEDSAGNVKYKISSPIAGIDTTAPVLSFDNNVAIGPTKTDNVQGNWGDAVVKKWMYSDTSTCPHIASAYDKTDSDSMNQSDETHNEKYICLYGEDSAGNVRTLPSEHPINIDITNPTCKIEGNPSTPTNQDVNLNVAYLVEAHQIVDGYSWNGENYSTTQGLTVTQNGTYTAYVKDAAGNVGSCSEEVTMIDKVLPEITINNPDTTPAKSKTITASTNKGTLYMSVGDDDTCDDSLNFVAYDSITFNLESDNGKYVCYKAEDSAGNVKYKISSPIAGIDTTAPVASIDTTDTSKSASQTATLSCTDEIGVVSYYWGTNNNPTEFNPIESTTSFSTTEPVDEEGTYYLLCKDSAGNVSNPASKTYYSYEVHNMLNAVDKEESTYNSTNYPQSSTATYLAPAGTTIIFASVYTIPKYSSLAKYVGYTTSENSTPSHDGSAVLNLDSTYYFWFDRVMYDLNLTKGTGIASIYYNVNGAGFVPTSNSLVVPMKAGSNAYAYAVASEGYTYNATSELSPWTITDVVASQEFSPSATINSYTITWKDGNGEILKTDTLEYGATPEYDGEMPTKTSTPEYSYTFNNTWNPAIEDVSGDATYTAQFDSTKRSYSITWLNDDDSLIDTTTVEYGIVPTHADPSKSQTAEYTYTFAGWDTTPVAVTGPATYKATYNATKRSYTITWKDGDGEVLKTETLEYGTTPAYIGQTPTKTATAQYSYTFNNTWDPAIVDVSGDATYIAQFDSTVNTYPITWKYRLENGTETTIVNNVAYDTKPTAPTLPATSQSESTVYTFTSWDSEIVNVNGAKTYEAQYEESAREYPITWKYRLENGTETTVVNDVAYGTKPTAPTLPTTSQSESTVYTFTSWDSEIVNVNGAKTYTAQYTESAREYPITWKYRLENGTETTVVNDVAYGTKPTAPTLPTTSQSESTVYTFTSWDSEIVNVNGAKTYTAQYTQSAREYPITWKYRLENGTETTVVNNVAYDTKPTAPTLPATSQSESTVYTFTAWDSEIVNVNGAKTYEAQYTQSAREYPITWKYRMENGTETTIVNNVAYGTKPTAPTLPTTSQSESTVYTFTSWDSEIVNVNGAKTYEAQYTQTAREYPITWKYRLENGTETTVVNNVAYGTKPTAPTLPATSQTESTVYTFTAWDSEIVNVNGAKTYEAQYTETAREYPITWKYRLENGTETTIVNNVAYGTKPTAPTLPATSQTESTVYTFTAWDSEIVNVNGAKTYTAQYTQSAREYTIVWKDYDGSVLSGAIYHYNDNLIVPVNPSRAADSSYTYEFKGWRPAVSDKVIQDVEYVAEYNSTPIKSGGSSSGGGGRRSSAIDVVEKTIDDNTHKAADDKEKEKSDDSQNAESKYSPEYIEAYDFAKTNGITTTSSIEKAHMNSPLTRIAMAKMLSYYAINVLGKTPDTTKKIKFNDVSARRNAEYDNGVTLAYQLGIMGINMKNNKFRPNDEVTRAEFVTALSRMIYEMKDGTGTMKYYEPHMARLYNEGIISQTNPKMKELRGWVMLMLYRSRKTIGEK